MSKEIQGRVLIVKRNLREPPLSKEIQGRLNCQQKPKGVLLVTRNTINPFLRGKMEADNNYYAAIVIGNRYAGQDSL